MPKPDPAHKETDKILRDMEKRLDEVYKQAYKEARQTADDFMKQFREMDKKKRQQVKDGELDKAEYERWRRTQVFQGNRYHQMADTLAADMTHTNQIAASVINGYLPEVYAVNHNYGTYEIEKGSRINTQYTMYDKQTVERLIRDNPDLLPRKAAVNVPKDQLWNKKHINSAVTQGILQGEAIDKIAQRLAATVTDMSHTSAIRNARTMTTSAQNGGRIDSYKRAEGMGIKMLQVWMATLDGRTRHEHRQLDGQKRKVGEAFEVEGEKIFFPGDPAADPALVYNCRCTLIGEVEGVDYNLSDVSQRDNKLGDMTYEEWKEEKKKQDNAEPPAPKPEPKPKAEDKPVEVEVPAPTVEKPDAVDEPIKSQEESQKLEELLKNAKNTREVSEIATEYFKQKGSKIEKCDLGICDLDAAKAICMKADELDSKFKSTLRSIECHRMPAEYGGQSVPDIDSFHRWLETPNLDSNVLITRMHLNEDGLKTKNAIKKEFNIYMRSQYGQVAQNPWVDEKNANLSTFVHEYGHTILPGKANEVALQQGKINRDYMPFKRLYNTYMRELRDIEKEMQKVRDSYVGQPDGLVKGNKAVQKLQEKYDSICISHYSKDSPGEFIAEALCDYELSSKPRETSVKVYETLVKLFGKENDK